LAGCACCRGSWGWTPRAPAAEELVAAILQAFAAAGGDFDAGREERRLLTEAGLSPRVRAEVVALEPGHPYLRLPVQFAASLRPRLAALVGDEELDALLAHCEAELSDPQRWGMTFALMQTWATVP
jgi:hypothetical protein